MSHHWLGILCHLAVCQYVVCAGLSINILVYSIMDGLFIILYLVYAVLDVLRYRDLFLPKTISLSV